MYGQKQKDERKELYADERKKGIQKVYDKFKDRRKNELKKIMSKTKARNINNNMSWEIENRSPRELRHRRRDGSLSRYEATR